MVLTRAQRKSQGIKEPKVARTQRMSQTVRVQKKSRKKIKPSKATKTPKTSKTPQKPTKTPKKTPRKSVRKSAKKSVKKSVDKTPRSHQVCHSSTGRSKHKKSVGRPKKVKQPKKEEGESVRIINNKDQSPTPGTVNSDQVTSGSRLMAHLNIFQPTQATFRLYAHIAVSIPVLVVAVLIAMDRVQQADREENGLELGLIVTLLLVLMVDMGINFQIGMKVDDDNDETSSMSQEDLVRRSLIGESIIRAIELLLLTQIFNQFNDTNTMVIIVGIELINGWIQLNVKHKDAAFLRAGANLTVLLGLVTCAFSEDKLKAGNSFYFQGKPFLQWAAGTLLAKTMVEFFDTPNGVDDYQIRQALVIAMRGFAALQICGQAYFDRDVEVAIKL